jgi:hypothetical protein
LGPIERGDRIRVTLRANGRRASARFRAMELPARKRWRDDRRRDHA